eukprot:CAMPEP_0202732496 /NCGR_PEP_ID=MMETSP1385-20130828/187688_1 /ASSEMBLY_ACC=CAM_ASM_000861 /TAXON_ID=933848 /ORGANISM="Elphidium margaritaceum" /LENGTH=279 /DNA_ID=CAMNT_0049398813 /DNA_START=30 /DNA_END=870 /DNA_ORIENTATION=-
MAMPRMPAGFPPFAAGATPQMPSAAGGAPTQFVRMPQQFSQNLDALEDKWGVDPKRWLCVYPCYLNKAKTVPEGRKIAKQYCVEQPHPSDMAECCKYFGLPFYVELNKTHPRDFFHRSRVRVLLKNKDGSLRRQDIPNKNALLIALGKTIPKLESRKVRLQREQQMIEKRQEFIEQKKKEQDEVEQQKQHKKETKQQKKKQKVAEVAEVGEEAGEEDVANGDHSVLLVIVDSLDTVIIVFAFIYHRYDHCICRIAVVGHCTNLETTQRYMDHTQPIWPV